MSWQYIILSGLNSHHHPQNFAYILNSYSYSKIVTRGVFLPTFCNKQVWNQAKLNLSRRAPSPALQSTSQPVRANTNHSVPQDYPHDIWCDKADAVLNCSFLIWILTLDKHTDPESVLRVANPHSENHSFNFCHHREGKGCSGLCFLGTRCYNYENTLSISVQRYSSATQRIGTERIGRKEEKKRVN